MNDFAPVALHGLPAELPIGERVLWQGRPDWRSLALHAFHVRKATIYFSLLLILKALIALSDGSSAASAILSILWLMPLAVACLAILSGLAFLSSRTTLYTITSQRLVMRIGIALPITLNIPYRIVSAANLKVRSDDTGDIPLALTGSDRAAFTILWPHARPWRVARPEPMLRSVPEAKKVAALLAEALGNASEERLPIRQPSASVEAVPLINTAYA